MTIKLYHKNTVILIVRYLWYQQLKLQSYSLNCFCICEADILLSQTWPYCYRMLTHSHSATSLDNWANLSQSEISLHQLFISRPHLNLRTGVVWPRVYCIKFFSIFTFWLQKYLDFGFFSPSYSRYYSKVIYQLTWKLFLIW
jgi:hypothetical protein